MKTRTAGPMKSAMTSKPLFVAWRNGLLHRNYAVGEKSAASGEYGECRRGLLQGRLSDPQSPVENESPVTAAISEVLGSPGQRPDAKTCALIEPRFGHDFSKLRVYCRPPTIETCRKRVSAHDGSRCGIWNGAIRTWHNTSIAHPEYPTAARHPTAPRYSTNPRRQTDRHTEPIPMQNGPGKGPAITVSNGWANPAASRTAPLWVSVS